MKKERQSSMQQTNQNITEQGLLIIVSGFSGAGKGTVTRRLVKDYPNYALSVSATSRAPRPGEVEGRDYFFKSRTEFEEWIARDQFIEYAQYVNNYYGTPKQYVFDCMGEGVDVILEIEVQGALQIKAKFPDAILVFMTPPCVREIEQRLEDRGTESQEVIEKRLARAREEVAFMDQYDYIVINDNLETCICDLHALIKSQHMRASHRQAFIDKMKKELWEV